MKHKFTVKGSKIEGKSVFATTSFKKGETICVFGGERISIPELKRRYKKGKERISESFFFDYTLPNIPLICYSSTNQFLSPNPKGGNYA